jgi:AraC-like DNA-binding protein
MVKIVDGPDFASATMMRVVAAGLSRQGISVSLPKSSSAHASLHHKRDVLSTVLANHGPRAVLSIADAARFMEPEPVAQALTRSKDIPDLMDRWHRLERFSHGCHTVQAEHLAAGRFRLIHRARDHGPAPTMAESLLVLGLLAIMAELVGSTDVTLTTAAGEVWRSHGKWHSPSAIMSIGSVILTAASARETANVLGTDLDPDPVSGLRSRLTSDPARRWTVANLAAETGASQRTLQRRLTERSVTFSSLVREARVQVAATHLCRANGLALAEIAFVAGFADQAHFARTFCRAVGTTPSSYRADFGH